VTICGKHQAAEAPDNGCDGHSWLSTKPPADTKPCGAGFALLNIPHPKASFHLEYRIVLPAGSSVLIIEIIV
jgi:hypothetical protein